LYQLGCGLQSYHERYGSLPPAYVLDAAGKPAHSWRMLITSIFVATSEPGVVGSPFSQYRFDESWNGRHNRQLANSGGIFSCPSDDDAASFARTDYVAVVGGNTAWPGDRPRKLADTRRISAELILLIELPETNIRWMEPRDISVEQAITLYCTGTGGRQRSRHEHGLHYVALGPKGVTIGTLSSDLNRERLLAMLRGE
jgi:hypothetical protein